MTPARAAGTTGPRSLLAVAAAAALVLGACSGGAGGTVTGAPPTSLLPSDSAPVTAATPTIAPTATPTQLPLSALTLLWRQGGPTPNQASTWAPAIDPLTGNVWVAVGFESRFWILSPDGKYLESWGAPGKGDGQFDFSDHAPNADGFGAIAFAPDGTFYVSDVGNHRVQKFSKDRRFITKWGSFGAGDGQFAQALEVVTDGRTVYVADGDAGDIQAFDPNGTFVRRFGSDGPFNTFLALDPQGNVYATNPGARAPKIGKFDPTGKEVATFDLSFDAGDPVGVAVAANGHIFVTFDHLDAVHGPEATYELDAAGTLIRGWSTAGESLLVAPDGKALYMAYAGPSNGWAYIEKYALP